jgi:matrixin
VRRAAAVVVVLAALCSGLDAFVILNDRWTDGSIVMHLQLGSSGTLMDGRSSWNSSAEDALATWNNYINRVKFRVVRDSTVPTGDNNGYNNVFFSRSLYGQSFGSSTLAVTTNWYRVSTRQRSEADVIFNTAFAWNSYSGAVRTASTGGPLADLHRVALHEFGHVLGLDHPDQAGQSFAAIMNSRMSSVEQLQSDDITGAALLYGGTTTMTAPGPPSGLATSASGSTVSLSWRAPASGGSPSAYVIEAGSASGLTNLASFSTGSTATSFSASGVGAGAYYVRVKATNAAGTSAPSNESVLIVGGGCAGAPGAPIGLTTTTTSGSTVTLQWSAASGNPTTYVIEAGSAPGIRARARNACGTGQASNEAILVVR